MHAWPCKTTRFVRRVHGVRTRTAYKLEWRAGSNGARARTARGLSWPFHVHLDTHRPHGLTNSLVSCEPAHTDFRRCRPAHTKQGCLSNGVAGATQKNENRSWEPFGAPHAAQERSGGVSGASRAVPETPQERPESPKGRAGTPERAPGRA